MLNNALQYLDDKRRRFQRADTAPDLHTSIAFFRSHEGSSTPTAKRRHRPSGSLQPSPEVCGSHSRHASRRGSLENLLQHDRRSNSVDFGKRLRVSPKSLRASPSVPSKLNKYTFVRRLTRYNSARSMDELKSEAGRTEKALRDANELFEAVEAGDVGTCREVLQRRPALLNAPNDLALTPLDVALLRSPARVADLLLSLGGRPNPRWSEPGRLEAHLSRRLEDVSAQVVELSGVKDRDFSALEQTGQYVKLLRHSLSRLPLPGPPARVSVEARSVSSLLVSLSPPAEAPPLCYRVEWSINADFRPVLGERIVATGCTPLLLEDLHPGVPLCVRAAAGNHRGWGRSRLGLPRPVAPSSWRQCSDTPEEPSAAPQTTADLRSRLDALLAEWTQAVVRPRTRSPLSQRKRSLKNLFAPASRFVRHLRPGGLHLCLLCHTGQRAATFEDSLPCLTVDDSNAAALRDLSWLAKLLAAPSELRALTQQLERWGSPGSVAGRLRLVQAVVEMQASLNSPDVGRVFPEVLKKGEASLLVLVRRVPDVKAVTLGAGLRWTSLSKLQRSGEEELPLDDFTAFSERASRPMTAGLYLCYMALKSHMDHLDVLVRTGAPGLLPSVRVRENAHVSRDEWQYVRDGFPTLSDGDAPARRFVNALAMAWNSLQVQLNLGSRDAADCQLYRDAVVELSPDVSLLLVFPPPSRLCVSLDEPLPLPSASFSGIPLQLFDLYVTLAHRAHSGLPLAASLAALLELVSPLAAHAARGAFSEREMEAAKQRSSALAALADSVESIRAGQRWAVEAVSKARDKASNGVCCVSLSAVGNALEENAGLPLPPPPVRVVLTPEGELEAAPSSGTLRIHAGYKTGLAEGTSVRLFLTHKTTAREIVELVVRQLNRAAAAKGSGAPNYGEEELPMFQLMVGLEEEETALPDEFHPLLLQPPWKEGKLIIRRKSDKARSRSPNPQCESPLATDV